MTNNLGATPPAQGYADAVKRTEELDQSLSDTSGRAVPDEKRYLSDEREDNVQGTRDDRVAPRFTAGSEPGGGGEGER